MSAVVLLALVVAGLVVGLVSGLVGIGGGVLIVPLLYLLYAVPEWTGATVATERATAVAHATSLFIIVPTALRGALTYHRAGLVTWRAAVPIGIGAIAGAAAGARLAVALPGAALRLGFGLVLVGSAVQLVVVGRVRGRQRLRLSPVYTLTSGFVIGMFSALLGVGGGILAIPVLIHLVGLDVHRVAATSLAVIVFAATSGALAYILSGWARAGLPVGSLGYVHVAAAVPILLGSLAAVRWGAHVNQRLGDRTLRGVFAALFLIIGVRLIIENAGVVL